MRVNNKETSRKRIHLRVRKIVTGTGVRPRLAIFRSARHIYAQVIDDETSRTLVSASSREAESGGGGNIKGAEEIGTRIAERCRDKGIDSVVFDRGGFKYHGRVKALADAARKGGLKF